MRDTLGKTKAVLFHSTSADFSRLGISPGPLVDAFRRLLEYVLRQTGSSLDLQDTTQFEYRMEEIMIRMLYVYEEIFRGPC